MKPDYRSIYLYNRTGMLAISNEDKGDNKDTTQ